MGGSSKSSSSTSSTQSTENYDQRVAVERDGVGVGANASVNVTSTDYGVIAGAKDIVVTSLKTVKDATAVNAKETHAILSDGMKTAEDVVSNVTDTFGKAMKQNTDILAAQMQNDNTEIATLVVKVMGGFAAVVGVAFIFLRGK